MKRLIIILTMMILGYTLYAQAPPFGINYQAMVLDEEGAEMVGVDITGQPLINRTIRVRFTIIKNTVTGPVTYREFHTTATDDNGLFNVIIGQGTMEDSPMEFKDIQWGTGNHYLKVEIDATGGTMFKHMSTTQFWSVPYALYAKYADQSLVPMYADMSSLPTGNLAPGMIAFVRNCIRPGVSCMVIWDGAEWINVDGDSDPTNELGLHVVADDAERDLLYPIPQVGDMVWNSSSGDIEVWNDVAWVSFSAGTGSGAIVNIYVNTDALPTVNNIIGTLAVVTNCDNYGQSCIMVWNGSNWVNTVEYIASNGITKIGQIFELGGALTHPTSINTSAVNTLAITGLQPGTLTNNDLVTVNTNTGVLTRTPATDMMQEFQVVYTATGGQTQFPTPIPITDINKVNVYRNGIRIGHQLINANTIQLETGIICVNNDQVRIVQFR